VPLFLVTNDVFDSASTDVGDLQATILLNKNVCAPLLAALEIEID
jgi:hypothetical protein